MHVWYDITALDTGCLCSWMTLLTASVLKACFSTQLSLLTCMVMAFVLSAYGNMVASTLGLLKSPEEQIGLEGKVVIS